MNDGKRPSLVIVAGPNGAGKSTVAAFLLANHSILRFINADTIARGMSISTNAHEQIGAGRVMLDQIHSAISARESIAFETTLSGKGWKKLISDAKSLDYEITICFVALRSVDLAAKRVAQRVALGGHFIPFETITRRFQRSLTLFFALYQNIADNWYLFDNSSNSAELIAAKESPSNPKIFNQETYDYFKTMALRSA